MLVSRRRRWQLCRPGSRLVRHWRNAIGLGDDDFRSLLFELLPHRAAQSGYPRRFLSAPTRWIRRPANYVQARIDPTFGVKIAGTDLWLGRMVDAPPAWVKRYPLIQRQNGTNYVSYLDPSIYVYGYSGGGSPDYVRSYLGANTINTFSNTYSDIFRQHRGWPHLYKRLRTPDPMRLGLFPAILPAPRSCLWQTAGLRWRACTGN